MMTLLNLMQKLGLRPPSKDILVGWTIQIQAQRRKSPRTPTFSVDSIERTPWVQTLREMVLFLDWVRLHQ